MIGGYVCVCVCWEPENMTIALINDSEYFWLDWGGNNDNRRLFVYLFGIFVCDSHDGALVIYSHQRGVNLNC